jgi:uncharacterized protein
MRFEWDSKKNEINIKKHGISFEEVKLVFDDPLHLAILDKRFNYFEERWITIGKVLAGKFVVVAHIYFDNNGEEVTRIISARIATPFERRQYES